MLIRLAFLSLKSRALTVGLTVFAIALSVALLLGVEKVRTGAKASFSDTISDTDLIVGARSGSVQLLLYSVFRIGSATNSVSWESFGEIANSPGVTWAVPLSLGDSHRQFRVLGTTSEYFDRYKYRSGRSLEFADGRSFDDLFDAVVGSDVAAELGYSVGDPIVVAHGIASFTEHEDTPFRISGILAKTGTPVDRTVIVSLEAIEAIHVDWQSGAQRPGTPTSPDQLRAMDLEPTAITAAMLGVDSRLQLFTLQRAINDYDKEPLLAIVPGLALQELWDTVGIAETALVGVSAMVVVTALLGMAAMLLSGLSARRREMTILRAVGARPSTIMGFLIIEALLMASAAAALGVGLLYLVLVVLQPILDANYGLFGPIMGLDRGEIFTLIAVVLAAGGVSLIPAVRAYRMSLSDGMIVKL